MRNLNVKVLQGIVKGSKQKLPNGRQFFRFLGIPYAKKPINELCFKSPQKLLKFDSPIIDCTKEGNICFQKSMFSKEFVGSEDCLYLNVYVPETSNSSKLAVMVFIHGGGFSGGSSSIQWYSPEYLLMENVIVVTVNYRLHVLGFLSLPTMGIPGNAGLKDQQMALEWVYENIENFGGDSENICLFGQSAGAASVHLHVLNRRSRKLIKSAICQSGCALADWVVQKNPYEKNKNLANLLGCSNIIDDKQIYKCIKEAPLESILNCAEKAGNEDEKRRNLKYLFTPCIEDPSDDAFMTKSPVELIKQEDINIPIIFGTTNKDGMLQTLPKVLMSMNLINQDLTRMIPMSLDLNSSNEDSMDLARMIKKFYFGEQTIDIKTVEKYFDLITDLQFFIPQTISNELHASFQHNSKLYLYEFRYDGDLNLFKSMLGLENYKGAAHIDDIFYLFAHENFKADLAKDSSALSIKSTMCKLWTNFAKHKNPTPDFDNPLSTTWKPVKFFDSKANSVNFNYLVIDEDMKMQKNVNQERINFWRDIIKDTVEEKK